MPDLPVISHLTVVEWWVRQTRFPPSHKIVYDVVGKTENQRVITVNAEGQWRIIGERMWKEEITKGLASPRGMAKT